MKVRHFALVLLLTIVLWCVAIPGSAQERVNLNMTNLGQVWQEYIAQPGPDTALKVYGALPAVAAPQGIELQVDVRDIIFKNLNKLESQVYGGERNALRIAFRLFLIADNEMQIELVKLIGYLLRFNTKMFLEELKTHEALVPDLEQLVCSFLLSNTEDKAQQRLEQNIRIKALGYVSEKPLKGIKKKCLKILKNLKIE